MFFKIFISQIWIILKNYLQFFLSFQSIFIFLKIFSGIKGLRMVDNSFCIVSRVNGMVINILMTRDLINF